MRDFLAAARRNICACGAARIPAEILAAWRQQHPGPTVDRLQGLLRGLAELRKPELTERQLLSWNQAFDSFRDEMLTAKRPARS